MTSRSCRYDVSTRPTPGRPDPGANRPSRRPAYAPQPRRARPAAAEPSAPATSAMLTRARTAPPSATVTKHRLSPAWFCATSAASGGGNCAKLDSPGSPRCAAKNARLSTSNRSRSLACSIVNSSSRTLLTLRDEPRRTSCPERQCLSSQGWGSCSDRFGHATATSSLLTSLHEAPGMKSPRGPVARVDREQI